MKSFYKLIGYGIGDFGLNIYWKTISLFLLYWYTTVIGLDPRIAGLVFFIGMSWDAISDPIMASISERVQSRFGTYRPFLLYGSITLAIAFNFLFWVPNSEGTLLIVILIGTAVIFRTAYTVVAIPYSAMASRLTYDSIERADYSGVRMFFAFLGLLAVSIFIPEMKDYFSEISGSETKGFQYVARVGSIVATIALLGCFLMTRELPLPKKTVHSRKIWTGIYRNVTDNRSLQYLLIIVLLNSAMSTCIWMTLIFYIEAHQNVLASESIVLTFYALATLVFVPMWTVLIHKVGRKRIWILATFIKLLAAIHLYQYGTYVIHGLPVQIIIYACCGGAFSIIFWAFVPDAVEFGQRDSGYRSEAGVFGSVMVAQKISGAFMALFVGFALKAFGIAEDIEGAKYLANLEQLTIFLAVVPVIILSLMIIPVWKLPLGRVKHAQIISDLQRERL